MTAEELNLKDGEYTAEVTMEGGSGRATIDSPTDISVKDGKVTAEIKWSSSHYDYMLVDGEKFLPVNTEGNSVFEIPVAEFDEPMAVTADTTAMSVPHEVEYTLTFASDTVTASGSRIGYEWIGKYRIVDCSCSGCVHAGCYQDETKGKEMKKIVGVLGVAFCLMLAGCASQKQDTIEKRNTDISKDLTYDHSMELEYAKMFAVDYYQNDYALVTIADDGKYLIVPEGESVPEDMDKDITVLQQPIQNIYLAASAAMDMFVATDALDAVRFSSLKADGWYIEEAKKAMEDGDIIYAGKYSAPDYEMILNENCGLAIENTMILHTPEVKEQMEKFNIPVLVDHSSYETNPLGRTEWVKLYGLLTGHEDQAEQAFDAEAKAFEQVSDQDATGKTVAFFYITTNGEANVRKSADYLPKMIELAGGSYIFDDLGDEEEATSTVSLQMEEFYAGAKDADYIIYNSTIEGELSSMQDLLAKSPLLEKFKAVKEGHVYCTTKNLYQSTMELGTITSDIRKMLTGDDADLTYLYKVE